MPRRMAAWRWLVTAGVLALAACEKEPPDLPHGHVTWLDGVGQSRFALRAKPYGFRVLAEGSSPWARIRRQSGEVELDGPGRTSVEAQHTPDGVQVKDAAGALHARVVVAPEGLRLFDRAAAPLGRIMVHEGRVTVYNAGGLPLGTVKASGGALVQRSRDGAISGTLLGTEDPIAAALLMLDDLPLEDRLALLALRLERR